ncbi:MAG: sigma-70 family RNA polymerase sigma factor [Clostridiales bacterium]|nr:sigma-70 family RNA polymerase sigma factor [Clostridiales bacterium]
MPPHSYDTFADEELAVLARDGDDGAFQHLIVKYVPMAQSRARAFSRAGLEADDLAQEGMIGLLGAIRVYDPKQASFSTFARLCIDRMLLSAVRQAGRQKRIPAERLIAADGPDDRPVKGLDTFGDENNPESILIAREEAERLRRRAGDALSHLEYQVLSAYLSGESYEEIARQLHTTVKSVDNALQRIRRKLR